MVSFSDLNLNITNLSDKSIDDLVEHSIRLGYDNIGLAIDYEFPSKKQDESSSNQKNKRAVSQVLLPKPIQYSLPAKLEARLKSCSRKIQILSRINVRIKPEDINTHMHHLKSKNVYMFDIIALEPVDNQTLVYLCTNNFNADIITINSGIECGLTDKHLIRPLNNAIKSFSLCFELNYSSSLTSLTERRDLIMAGRCLGFNTKVKGLLISSRASQKIHLRGPYDILNIVQLFDISQQDSHKLLRMNPQQVLMNSFCRKHTSTGMVYINDDESNGLRKLQDALVSYKRKLEDSKMELDEKPIVKELETTTIKQEIDKKDIKIL